MKVCTTIECLFVYFSPCAVHIVGTCGGTEFEDRVVSFDQGEGKPLCVCVIIDA